MIQLGFTNIVMLSRVRSKIMKKNKYIFALVTCFLAFTANAKVSLEDNSQIIGVWSLYAEAAAMHKEKVPVDVTWEFKKDGQLLTKARDKRGRTGLMKIKLKYFIENGEIKKQKTPGREKYESCHVTKLEGTEMVLKCEYLYFFLKKI